MCQVLWHSFSICYNRGMESYCTADVLRIIKNVVEPVERAGEMFDLIEGEQLQARKAAVLLPLFDLDGEAAIVLIKRSQMLRSHSGEIAFPGGRAEPGDSSPVMTALREAREEIGLDPAQVEVMGVLEPVFTVVSNYLIVPVVAYLPRGLGQVRLQASEVAELIVAPLRALADPEIAHTEQWTRDGRARTVYFYDYGAYCIWGATGRMLNTLLSVVETRGVQGSLGS